MLNCFSRVQFFCDAMDCSPQAPLSLGILQAQILEFVAMPSSRGSSRPRDRTRMSSGSYIAGRFFTAEPPGKPRTGPWSSLKRGAGALLLCRAKTVTPYPARALQTFISCLSCWWVSFFFSQRYFSLDSASEVTLNTGFTASQSGKAFWLHCTSSTIPDKELTLPDPQFPCG